jgi:MFS superfamily sulfate permease-like transporter
MTLQESYTHCHNLVESTFTRFLITCISVSEPGYLNSTSLNLIALAFAYFARRAWGEWLRWRSVYGFICLATLAMLVTAAVFPILNAKNSYSPFFDQVRDQLRDRELYRTLLDDRRLPLPLLARSNRSFW